MNIKRMIADMWRDRRDAEQYLLLGSAAGGDGTWMKAIEITEKQIGQRKRCLLAVRREDASRKHNVRTKGRPGWVVFAQMRYMQKTAKNGGDGEYVGERTLHAWWNDIIVLAVEIHLRMSL